MTLLVAFFAVLLAAAFYTRGGRGGRGWAGATSLGLMLLAWSVLIGKLAVRGVISGHWPLSNQYEFTLCFIWIVLTIHILLQIVRPAQRIGAYVCLIVLLLLGRAIAMPALAKAIGPLPPVLRSAWLQGHVLTVMVAYGAYGVAAGAALASLAAGRRRRQIGPGSLLPPDITDEIMRRLLALAFPWLTLGILTGAVWAHRAWGRYWGWDPKETWALITWLWYLLVFHLGSLRTWRGKRLSWLVLVGFGLVMFTFVGVPALTRALTLETLHGY